MGRLLEMVRKGDVKAITVVNGSRADIFLTKEAKKKDDYKKDVGQPNPFQDPNVPTYYLKDIGEYEVFRRDMQQCIHAVSQSVVTMILPTCWFDSR
jgi:hypothetical protein